MNFLLLITQSAVATCCCAHIGASPVQFCFFASRCSAVFVDAPDTLHLLLRSDWCLALILLLCTLYLHPNELKCNLVMWNEVQLCLVMHWMNAQDALHRMHCTALDKCTALDESTALDECTMHMALELYREQLWGSTCLATNHASCIHLIQHQRCPCNLISKIIFFQQANSPLPPCHIK